MNRSTYLLSSLRKRLLGRGRDCPSCGASKSDVIDRKYLVTTLRRCKTCDLLFRSPTTSEAEMREFYQASYHQGFTTTLPSRAELASLLASGFNDHEKSYRSYLDVLSMLGLGKGARVFDFGCSWGYGSYQLRSAGYRVDSHEISEPRAAYAAENLGVTLMSPERAPSGSYDAFFSAHVIEHVPSVSQFLALAQRLLRPGGLFVAFTPNGSDAHRRVAPFNWHMSWGLVHPQLIDEVFVARQAVAGWVVASTPYPLDKLRSWDGRSHYIGAMEGEELMMALKV